MRISEGERGSHVGRGDDTKEKEGEIAERVLERRDVRKDRKRMEEGEREYRCEGACACHCYIPAPATKLGSTFWRTRTHHIRSSCYSRVYPAFLPGAEHLATNCVKRVHDFEWRVSNSRDDRRDTINHSLCLRRCFRKIRSAKM